MKVRRSASLILRTAREVLRKGLAVIINGFEGCKVICDGGTGKEVIAAFEKGLRPDLLILDLNMPEMDGYKTADWMKANHPEVKIIILSMFDTEVAVVRLLKKCVNGFLKKDIGTQGMMDAIEAVVKGGYYYCERATTNIANFFTGTGPNGALIEKGFFSEEEFAFLKLCATEMPYKEIASRLGINVRTADTIRGNLFEKLSIQSRAGLAVYAVKNGIVSF